MGLRRSPVPAVLLACAVALLLAACSARQAPAPVTGHALVEATPLLADEDRVDLSVYLRSGRGPDAHLVAVTRHVAIAEDLPRRALELLLTGPEEDDDDLRAPLPPGTRVLGFHTEGDTAVVDLSPEAVEQAHAVGPTPEHELLALAAVANTLTEFPAIDHVRLTVAGGGAEFWGGWGLPPLLSRDESVIGPHREGEQLPSLTSFVLDEQRIGSADAPPVRVRDISVIDRLAFLRVVVELGDGGDDVPAVGVPPTRAWLEQGRLVLEVDQVLDAGDAEPAPGQQLLLDDLPFEALEAAPAELPGPLRLTLAPGDGHAFWLHTLTSPTRVVLDVRK